MTTTLQIDDELMRKLKQEAARQGRSVSELVEAALQLLLLRPRPAANELPPLPAFRSGGALVEVADRDALGRAMEGQ